MRPLALAIALGALTACGQSPYEPYFDEGAGPTLTGLTPETTQGTLGGGQLTLEGTGLADVTTVVVGGRNATFEVSGSSLLVDIPATTAGGGAVEVAVASPSGIARLDRAFTYVVEHSDFFANEGASVALTRLRCPITASMRTPGDDLEPLFWCGADLGYGGASGWDGPGAQPGLAGTIGGIAPIASLPPVGEVKVYGPGEQRPLLPYQSYQPHAEDAYLAVTTPRDFARDIGAWEAHAEVLEATYPWPGEFSDGFGLDFRLYSDAFSECYVDLPFEAGLGFEADVDGDPMDADYFEEILWWEDADGYYVEGILSTGLVDSSSPGLLVSEETGAVVWYDAYSGAFDAGYLALYDIPEASYDVSRGALGEEESLGTVDGPTYLSGFSDDLMAGTAALSLSAGATLSWDPISAPAGPVVVVAELRIYDADELEPGGWFTELFRVVGQGSDADGSLTWDAAALAGLPLAPNRIDDNTDLIGLHGELTLARHELRSVDLGDGEETLVIDFVDAVQVPIRIEE